MNEKKDIHPPDDQKAGDDALHGARTEVSWDGGSGRQPYTNQGDEEQGVAADPEYAEGDRGKLSGNNLEQLAEVRRKS
jgi:hypothetical protein